MTCVFTSSFDSTSFQRFIRTLSMMTQLEQDFGQFGSFDNAAMRNSLTDCIWHRTAKLREYKSAQSSCGPPDGRWTQLINDLGLAGDATYADRT
jgi:hypothetical protein